MRRTERTSCARWVCRAVLTLVMVAAIGLFVGRFSITSLAESAGKAKATAKIRQEPSTSSAQIGSVEAGKTVSIKSQVTGADGYTWYEIYKDASTTGYVRSDLVTITDGTTPPGSSWNGGGGDAGGAGGSQPSVEALEPVSASVTGSNAVRVRQSASTGSDIVTTVSSGLALTVNGRATGTDGNVWYQVSFIANGSEVTGFIRYDYVALSGELVPAAAGGEPATDPGESDPEVGSVPNTSVEPPKDYETKLEGGVWYVVDNNAGVQYDIAKTVNDVNANAEAYRALKAETDKKIKGQKVVIIVLVFLCLGMAGGLVYLFLRFKDTQDNAYYRQVEKETMQQRGQRRSSAGGNSRDYGSGQRAQGGRPAQGARAQGNGQGAKAQGGGQQGRPQGSAGQQGRPQGSGQQARPQGNAPQGGGQQGTRPQGSAGQQGRPQGGGQQARPQGNAPQGGSQQGARPQGSAGQQGRPQGGGQQARPQGNAPQGGAQQGARPQGSAGQQGRPQGAQPKPKNFMEDEDEFEYEFLHWDGQDDK